jgi:hypothetical protein
MKTEVNIEYLGAYCNKSASAGTSTFPAPRRHLVELFIPEEKLSLPKLVPRKHFRRRRIKAPHILNLE